MLINTLSRKFQPFCSRIWRLVWRRSRRRATVIVRRFKTLKSKVHPRRVAVNQKNVARPSSCSISKVARQAGFSNSQKPIRIATFNAAMFSLAPAVPEPRDIDLFQFMTPASIGIGMDTVNLNDYVPKSMLSPLRISNTKRDAIADSERKVLIRLPDKEVSLSPNNTPDEEEQREGTSSSKKMTTNREHRSYPAAVRSPLCFPCSAAAMPFWSSFQHQGWTINSSGSILELLDEVGADVLALQDVKADEENGMRPLSDLAAGLGMNYVFAESWAPEFGNAILSKWPIKRWKVDKIVDDEDFRNLLKATIDVPLTGEMEFHCTQLDHLDENWRMKQVHAIIQASDCPNILAGGLNSHNASDYSPERWSQIAQYYEKMGKPAPKAQVMRFLKEKGHVDAGDYSAAAGELEDPVIIVPKGQNVQGTCKHGTRVDYIMATADSPYKFVPGSYAVISSKGTSDHHVVRVDVQRSVRH